MSPVRDVAATQHPARTVSFRGVEKAQLPASRLVATLFRCAISCLLSSALSSVTVKDSSRCHAARTAARRVSLSDEHSATVPGRSEANDRACLLEALDHARDRGWVEPQGLDDNKKRAAVS